MSVKVTVEVTVKMEDGYGMAPALARAEITRLVSPEIQKRDDIGLNAVTGINEAIGLITVDAVSEAKRQLRSLGDYQDSEAINASQG